MVERSNAIGLCRICGADANRTDALCDDCSPVTEPQEDFLDAIHGDPDMPPKDAAFWTEAAARDYLRRAEAAETRLAAVAAACDEARTAAYRPGIITADPRAVLLHISDQVRAAMAEGAGDGTTGD